MDCLKDIKKLASNNEVEPLVLLAVCLTIAVTQILQEAQKEFKKGTVTND